MTRKNGSKKRDKRNLTKLQENLAEKEPVIDWYEDVVIEENEKN